VNRRPVAVLAAPVVVLLVTLVLGVVGAPLVGLLPGSPTPGSPTVERTSATLPDAGGVVCITGAGATQTTADLLLLAAPSGPDERVEERAEERADERSRGVVLTFGETASRTSVGPLAAGDLERSRPQLGAEGWVWAGWADHPLTAWQEWRSPGGPGEPRGVAASRCLATDPAVQTVIGLRTDGGNEALLRLANPFVADATFAVRFVTAEGPVDPVALRNVSVPAGTRVTVRLNDHVPEESDVAAIVSVGAGRLAVEGLQRSIAALGDVEGISVIPPVTVRSIAWTIPWLQVGPDVEGSVWILNPEPRTVEVQLTLHTAQGETVPDGVDSVDVRAGALVRIDAADLAPEGRRTLGVTLRSETTAIAVAAGARFLDDDPRSTGLVGFAAATGPDPVWSVAGTSEPGRETVLHVVNLGGTVAAPRVDVTTLASASGEGSDAGASRTVTLEPPPIPPGAVARIILPLDGVAAWAAVVSGGPGLVVSRTTFGQGRLEPVVTDATPSSAWTTPGRALGGRPLDGWVAGLGTATDLRRDPRTPARTG
jgi:hypothetical protein